MNQTEANMTWSIDHNASYFIFLYFEKARIKQIESGKGTIKEREGEDGDTFVSTVCCGINIGWERTALPTF